MLANKNNLRSELTSNVSSSATSINITSGEGILRENNMVACLEHYEGEICTKREIVKITAKNSDSFTVSRGFAVCIMNDQTKEQGSTAQSFSTGDFLSLYFSKELRESITTGCVNNAEAIAQMSEHITTIKNCIDGCCNNRIAKVGCLNDSHFTNGGFGNASDGDCVVEAGNHFRCADHVYNFRNLTICEGACIRFEGEGVPQIKVYDHYINNGVIDTRAGYKKTCACSKQICFGKCCCASGDNSDNNCIVPGTFGCGGLGLVGGRTEEATGTGRVQGCPGCCASGNCGGAGGKGGDNYSYCCNCWTEGGAGSQGDGENGGAGGHGEGYHVLSGGDCLGGGGGGGGGAGRFGNGGAGGVGGSGGGTPALWTYSGANGGCGGNSGLWGCGGTGGRGGTGTSPTNGGRGGTGGCGYIGGEGGEGGTTGYTSACGGYYCRGGHGGNGNCGVICGGNGGSGGRGRGAGACGGAGGNALTNIYGLIMNVRCACGTGCIRACGGTGGNGGGASTNGQCGTGGNGGNGANGGQVIYAYMHGTPETICVNGGAGGCGGCGNGGTDGTAGTAGTDGRKLVYMVSTDLDLARFIATQDEEYLLRLLSSESGIEAVAGSTEALRIIANDTELLSDVLSYTTIVNALISDSTCLGYIAGSHTSMVLVKDNTTIMNALVVDSTALGAISQQDFFDYVLENETFLATCVGSTAGANKVNSIDADDLLEPIYFYTGDLGYDSWTTLSEDDTAMETLENNANAMLIIESNDECMEYFGNVPKEYQEVEYIQSSANGSGTGQYINTGVLIENSVSLKVEIDFHRLDTATEERDIFGYYQGQYNDYLVGFIRGTFNAVLNSHTNGTLPTTWTPNTYSTNTRYKVIAEGTTVSSNNTPYLFASNENGTRKRDVSAKLYYCKIWKDNTLVRDFYPCYRKSDGVIGLYDKVSKTFFTNSGTGTFLKGHDVNIKRSEFQKVEYIETTGTQYILTGLFAGNNIKVETDIELSTSQDNISVFGSRGNWTQSIAPHNYYHITPYQNAWYYGLNNSEGHAGTYVYVVGTKHNIIYNDENSKLVIDNSELATLTGTVGFNNSQLAISNRGLVNQYNPGKFKYFTFKMFNKTTGEYERDFIPCYKKSTGEIGMIDDVNKVFYTNDGTGTFTKGGDIN